MGLFEATIDDLLKDGDPRTNVWVLRFKGDAQKYAAEIPKEKSRFTTTFQVKRAKLFSSRLQALKWSQQVNALDRYEPIEVLV